MCTIKGAYLHSYQRFVLYFPTAGHHFNSTRRHRNKTMTRNNEEEREKTVVLNDKIEQKRTEKAIERLKHVGDATVENQCRERHWQHAFAASSPKPRAVLTRSSRFLEVVRCTQAHTRSPKCHDAMQTSFVWSAVHY